MKPFLNLQRRWYEKALRTQLSLTQLNHEAIQMIWISNVTVIWGLTQREVRQCRSVVCACHLLASASHLKVTTSHLQRCRVCFVLQHSLQIHNLWKTSRRASKIDR